MLGQRFTGSWMDFQLAKTLEAARLLLPDTKKVVVVSGSSQYDKATLKLAKASLADHPVPLELSYLTDLDMSSLLEQLRHLQTGTIVLLPLVLSGCTGQPVRERDHRSPTSL